MTAPRPINSTRLRDDDPRHGTNAGYYYGCRDTCCRTAQADYRRSLRAKRYLKRAPRLYIDATGTQRRIRALQAMGWRLHDIDAATGNTRTWTHNLLAQDKVHVDTARKIAALYERLCMTPGPSPRTAALAKRYGWLLPLAWDDIDNDPEPPAGEPVELDEVVVERILDGERIEATQEEKAEVVRRWLAAGRPLAHLEAQTGWNGNRERLRATQKGVA